MFSRALKITRASESIGLYLGRQCVSVVHIVCGKSSCEVVNTEEIPCRLYHEKEALNEGELESALARVTSVIHKNGLPVHVALPSALGSSFIKTVKTVPKNNSLREALVHMEIGDERNSGQSIEVKYQILGPHRGGYLLYGAAMPVSIVSTLQQQVRKANLVLDKLNFDYVYIFNHVRDRFYVENESAIVITLNADSWASMVWDQQGRLRLVRSGWRRESGENGAGSEFKDLVTEIERHIRAYVHHDEPEGIARVLVSVENPADIKFADLLEGRMKNAPFRMDLRQSTPFYKNCLKATSLIAMSAAFDS